jgi:hypothetical protein
MNDHLQLECLEAEEFEQDRLIVTDAWMVKMPKIQERWSQCARHPEKRLTLARILIGSPFSL